MIIYKSPKVDKKIFIFYQRHHSNKIINTLIKLNFAISGVDLGPPNLAQVFFREDVQGFEIFPGSCKIFVISGENQKIDKYYRFLLIQIIEFFLNFRTIRYDKKLKFWTKNSVLSIKGKLDKLKIYRQKINRKSAIKMP